MPSPVLYQQGMLHQSISISFVLQVYTHLVGQDFLLREIKDILLHQSRKHLAPALSQLCSLSNREDHKTQKIAGPVSK